MADDPTQTPENGQPDDDMSEDEKLAAEWGAMADEEEAEEEGDELIGADEMGDGDDMDTEDPDDDSPTAKVLNQDEIDSLLGFDEEGDEENSGIMALVNNALVNYERLPMLDVVFDRLGRLLSTSLRNLTSDNVEASIDDIISVRFGDYLNSIPLPAMLAVFKAEEWDNQGLIVADSALIYSIVDVLLGGRRGTAAMRIEGRPYTTIEANLVERMLHVVLNDLSAAFDPLSPVSFRFERLETNPRFAAITQSTNAAVLAKIRIDMEDRGGMLELIIPYATLEPIRELLLQGFMGEKFGRDSIWENHLTEELYQTEVEMDAILGEITVSLNEAMKWTIGSTIQLEQEPDDLVEMRCGPRTMFNGRMGKKGEHIAVRLKEEVLPEDEEYE
jgi:flagellar motor switch protein FliM